MMYKALVGFSGAITMKKGEVKEIKDKTLVDDLTKAKYIEAVEKPKKGKASKKGE